MSLLDSQRIIRHIPRSPRWIGSLYTRLRAWSWDIEDLVYDFRCWLADRIEP
jgi:hypothetical protein